MKQIDVQLPTVRTLSPYVAYATGVICENRPDLANEVRSAVLGDRAEYELNALILARIEACFVSGDDAGADVGANAVSYLRRVCLNPEDNKALRALVDALGLIRECPDYCVWCERPDGAWLCLNREDPFIEEAGLRRSEGSPPLGATWAHPCGPGVFGIPRDVTSSWRGEEGAAKARQAAAVWQALTTSGFEAAWALLPRETLWSVRKWVIAVAAHTISPDPAVRATWAKAHIDALT